MIGLIPGEVWSGLIALVSFIAAMLGARFFGVKSAKKSAELRNAKAYQKTMERMNEEADAKFDVNDSTQWLRDRSKR